VAITVSDTAPSGGVTAGQWAPIVVTGTPAASASLANLFGVGSVPLSSLLLAYVLVPANATSIVTADTSNAAGVARHQNPAGVTSGTLAARPAAGVLGREYYATDTSTFYQDTGTAWIASGTTFLRTGTDASKPTPSAANTGEIYEVTGIVMPTNGLIDNLVSGDMV
jgi:hypothetical protein